MKSFNEWVSGREAQVICEGTEGTIWERHKQLPSIFTRTYYALPTSEQVEEFQDFQHLTAEDIVQGFGYTIVGRGVSSPDNCKKIVESIRMLTERYPDNEAYKDALVKAQEEAEVKLAKWKSGVRFP